MLYSFSRINTDSIWGVYLLRGEYKGQGHNLTVTGLWLMRCKLVTFCVALMTKYNFVKMIDHFLNGCKSHNDPTPRKKKCPAKIKGIASSFIPMRNTNIL